MYLSRFLLSLTIAALFAVSATAQQAVVSSPFNRTSSSFHENIGVNFGFSIPGGNGRGRGGRGGSSMSMGFNNAGPINFNQGNFSAAPPFGNFDPNAGARFGFATRGKSGTGFFNVTAGQGFTSSNISQTPSVVVPNGGTGSFFHGSVQPFVTGVVPVVGGYPMAPSTGPTMTQSVLAERVARLKAEGAPKASPKKAAAIEEEIPLKLGAPSTAEQGDLSVAEIRRRRAAGVQQIDNQGQQELALLIERGRGAEEAGKANVARIFYQQAARRADGELKQRLLAKIASFNADR